MNKTFCIVPWTHTYISPQSERRMCCASREQPSFQKQYIDQNGETKEYSPLTLEEHWNSEHMKDVRRRMMAGEILPECKICNDQILNLWTYRQYFNETLFPEKMDEAFEKTDDSGFTTMEPISFDYRLSNLCNFKCRMCGEQLSSSWESEKRILGMWDSKRDAWMVPDNKNKIQSFQKNVVEKELIDAIEEERIEEIYWVGGEPLMWETHWEAMKKMVQNGTSKNVVIRYNTNLSRIEYKEDTLYELLPHFKNVNICASIDGTKKIGEFIRTGLVWEKWLDNFKAGLFLRKQFGNDAIVLDVTLTTPGLFDMKNMIDLALELDVKSYVKTTFAFDSSVLMCPLALPRKVLDEILDDLISYCSNKITPKTQVYLDTFQDMKTKKTFEEQYSDYREGFYQGKAYLQKIANHRKDPISMEDILSKNTLALNWWENGYE